MRKVYSSISIGVPVIWENLYLIHVLAIMPATSHIAVINQVDLLIAFIEPFLKGKTPKGFFEN
jgi:hypothetical protein